jgi:hypothetical protein
MLPTEPVEVHRAPLVSSAYTARRDWGNAELVWSGRAMVQPDRAFWPRSPERETTQDRLNVYLPLGAAVESADRLFVLGEWWEVEGEPQRWPHGAVAHTRIKVWKVRR